MKTFTELVDDFKTLSRDNSTENETLGKTLINQFLFKILGMRDWTFNRGSFTDITTTYAADPRNNIPIPYNAGKIIGVKIMSGEVPVVPTEIMDRNTWSAISRTSTTSDHAQYFFVDTVNQELLFFPYFSRSADEVTVYFQKNIFSRSVSDYATGTASRSAASKSVRGTSTVWTWEMRGRYIKFENDPYWDEIASVESGTTLTTRREGRTATDDGDYKISEVISLPFGHEDLPLWWALELYFTQKESPQMASYYKGLRIEGLDRLDRSDSKSTGNVLTKSLEKEDIRDVNKFPLDMS